jgi:hypothetical protein
MAQTAKVLAENPLLVRLKELEAYKELAANVGQVHVVLGDILGYVQELLLRRYEALRDGPRRTHWRPRPARR